VAVALIVGAVVVLGGKAATTDPVMIESYFAESVQGLDVGAAVKMKGVPIGKVEDIDFTSNLYDTTQAYVMVLLKVDRAKFRSAEGKDPGTHLPGMLERGLRTRLTSAGITGGVYLEIDFLAEEEREWDPPLDAEGEPKQRYIPSAPSTITRLKRGVEDIFQELADAEVPETMQDIRKLLEDLDAQLTGPIEKILGDISKTTEELPSTVQGIRDVVTVDLKDDLGRITEAAVTLMEDDLATAVQDLDAEVKRIGKDVGALVGDLDETVNADLQPALENIRKTSESLPETIERVNRTLRRLDRVVAGQQANVDAVLENLRVVSADLRQLVSAMKRHPSGALFGDPPGRVRKEDD
jgi:ABC-type transporter Mla subunit MlaD